VGRGVDAILNGLPCKFRIAVMGRDYAASC
jgi:hypothetical protein